jgi:mono/diheme cytochrome c family protein
VRHFLLGVLATIAIIVVAGFAYLRLGLAETRADMPPSKLENLIAGGRLYLDGCAGCHGTPGKPKKDGDDGLFPPVPQLPQVGTEYTEAQMFWIIKQGVRRTGMFANGRWDTDKEIWTMAAYIKRILSLPPRVQEELAKPKSTTPGQ